VDAGMNPDLPPQVVGACPTGNAPVGVWENVSPPQVDLSKPTKLGNNLGFKGLVMDPSDPRILYLGTDCEGIYKTTDCGATWTKVSTGRNAAAVSSGRNWTMLIDPVDPKVLYTVNGYGTLGVFKSTNGGVDWDQLWSDDFRKKTPYAGFVMRLAMDPNDHQHILAAFHAPCLPGACLAETTDAGANWSLMGGDPSWVGSGWPGEIEFLTSTTWLFGSQADGMWRSPDSGATWTKVSKISPGHLPAQLYRASDGGFFQGAANGLLYSANGTQWDVLPGSPNNTAGLVGDGKTLYIGVGFPYGYPGADLAYKPYYTVTEKAPGKLVQMDSPTMRNGGLILALDTQHHLLYAMAGVVGLWRVGVSP
jgi:photosystem II stability/assembly factor-like uncharacterized protein